MGQRMRCIQCFDLWLGILSATPVMLAPAVRLDNVIELFCLHMIDDVRCEGIKRDVWVGVLTRWPIPRRRSGDGRIRHLVYLDSLILENGQSPFSVLPPDVVAARRKLVAEQGQGAREQRPFLFVLRQSEA
jgi:hypothetical protein